MGSITELFAYRVHWWSPEKLRLGGCQISSRGARNGSLSAETGCHSAYSYVSQRWTFVFFKGCGNISLLISLFLLKQFSKMPYAAKAKAQQFARRKPNLIKKANQLTRMCHADVALIIRRNGRYYIYRSIDHEQWPSTISETVSNTVMQRP